MEEEEATVLILICGVSAIAVEGIRQTRLSYMTWLTPGPNLCHLLIFLHNVRWSALFLLPVSNYLKPSTWFCLSCFLSVLSNLLEKLCSFHSFFSSIALKYRCKHACIVQELCESRGGRPGLSVLTSLLVSVDVKNY